MVSEIKQPSGGIIKNFLNVFAIVFLVGMLCVANHYVSGDKDVSCKVTFKGGCKQHNKLKIKVLGDRRYSVKECFERCGDTKKCAGFFINNENKSCHLYKKGCTKTPEQVFTYYSMDDCKVPDVDVDDKTWCCTKIRTDNVIPGKSFGSMTPGEIKEWKSRKCCSPQKSWGCCKK